MGDVKQCPLCGSPVQVIGKTTHSYAPLDTDKLMSYLRQDNQALKELLREATGLLSYRNRDEDVHEFLERATRAVGGL